MNYEEQVKALRHCTVDVGGFTDCRGCPKEGHSFNCETELHNDAAAAIEDLEGFLAEAERDRDEYEDRMRKEQERVIELQAEFDALKHDIERYVGINAELTTEIEALQAEVNRLKESNEELREKQTYIDHYGDKWMTSAKDVPTAAYEHGYMDGRDEAMAKMEVQE